VTGCILHRSMKYLQRAFFGSHLFAEFAVPAQSSTTAVVYCGGCPGYPGGKKEAADFFTQRGAWFFVPRYKGTWESHGMFLNEPPHNDIYEFYNLLDKGCVDGFTGEQVEMRFENIILVGASFGGAAALLLSSDPRVSKVVALSPVCDWRIETEGESMDDFFRFMRNGFGEAYRIAPGAEKRLRGGVFYNPMRHTKHIDGSKVLIIHPADDTVTYASTSSDLAEKVGARILVPASGGHLGLDDVLASPALTRTLLTHIGL
jgi:hypothetical protein